MRTSEQWVEEVMENVDQYFMLARDIPHDDFPIFVCAPRKAIEEFIRISDRKHDAWDEVKKALAEYKDA